MSPRWLRASGDGNPRRRSTTSQVPPTSIETRTTKAAHLAHRTDSGFWRRQRLQSLWRRAYRSARVTLLLLATAEPEATVRYPAETRAIRGELRDKVCTREDLAQGGRYEITQLAPDPGSIWQTPVHRH